jgi:hypothetical protein
VGVPVDPEVRRPQLRPAVCGRLRPHQRSQGAAICCRQDLFIGRPRAGIVRP